MERVTRHSLWVIVTACSFPVFLFGQGPTEIFAGHEVASRSVIVKLRPGSTLNVAQAVLAHDLDRAEPLTRKNDLLVLHSRSKNVAALLSDVGATAGIAYVEPNHLVRIRTVPNDPGFNQLWGLLNSGKPGADIGATAAWNLSTGSSANVIGIVDSGIDYTHPDLAANIWSAPASFTVNVAGTSITCPAGSHGFNAITNTCDPKDDDNHGTHVSGTIGAVGNNGLGVVGVNWTTRMMGLKFIASDGTGIVSDAVKAIEFAIQVKAIFAGTATPVNVRVLSNSWGGTGYSQSLLDEINAANSSDMLFVAAAGNSSSNDDTNLFYPAGYNAPNMISVAATDSIDNLAGFSNYGPQTVHMGAPGVNILSTLPGASYGYYSGTSMATPHVAGAAMLVLSTCPLSTPALKSNLLSNVDLIPALAGITSTGGRLNVGKAIQACGAAALSGISAAPSVLASGQSSSLTVSLSAPAGAGGVVVALSTSYAAGASVPPSLNIPQGSTSASVTVTSGTVAAATSVTLTASYLGVSKNFVLTVNPQTPPVVSVTPPSGNGATQAFQFLASDSVGATDLQMVWAWFTPTFSGGANSCMLYYNRSANVLNLLNDGGSAWITATPGTAGTLQNSQCSVDLSTTTAAPSGNNLTLSLAMTFKAAYTGAKQVWMYAAGGGGNSGWHQIGAWTVP